MYVINSGMSVMGGTFSLQSLYGYLYERFYDYQHSCAVQISVKFPSVALVGYAYTG